MKDCPIVRATVLGLSVFTLVLSLAVAPAAAQTPAGYMGKRFVAELDIDYNPLVSLIANRDDAYGLSAGLGIGASVHYVVKARNTLGLSLAYRNFGKPAATTNFGRDAFQSDDASTELLAVVEYRNYGGRYMPNLAPLGGAMIYGFGIARYSGVTAAAFSREATAAMREPVSWTTPVFRIGYQNRFIFKDKFSVTPWTRVDVSGATWSARKAVDDFSGFDDLFEEFGGRPLMPNRIAITWRTGVSVGYVF